MLLILKNNNFSPLASESRTKINKGFYSTLSKMMGLSIMPFIKSVLIRHENKILISLSEDDLLISRSGGVSDDRVYYGYLS
ncbi:hypothetical protein Pan241w_44220 [Gimesia alba]|uniref:Uncharacterized protein n=1 Tax=Gimesia alba TaxID=2527973 RepID=A0A517RKA5_9PLAN|nr:hypothetical protein Pan241w_44220 [Gimesia alba]